jgi:hypothetical protein
MRATAGGSFDRVRGMTTISLLSVLFALLSVRNIWAKTCLAEVKKQVIRAGNDENSFTLKRHSLASINQKVIGPLRRNQLTEKEEQEIERMSAGKSFEFYEVNLLGGEKLVSEFLAVGKTNCKITRRYVLLGRAEI